MTIDNLQQPSGESLRDAVWSASGQELHNARRMQCFNIAVNATGECHSGMVYCPLKDFWPKESSWPWGGIATTEDYR